MKSNTFIDFINQILIDAITLFKQIELYKIGLKTKHGNNFIFDTIIPMSTINFVQYEEYFRKSFRIKFESVFIGIKSIFQ